MENRGLTDALRSGPDCLSIERLAHYSDGLLPVIELQADELHVATCGNCQAELALLHAFAASTVRDDERAVVDAAVEELRRREMKIFGPVRRDNESWDKWSTLGRLPVWFGGLRPALTLAVVLLAVVGGYYLRQPAAPRLPADVSAGSDVARSMGVPVLDPVGDQTAVPGRFRWQPVGGASRYHVRLMEVDRQEIWSSDTADVAIDLPAAVQARISPAKTLVWQVTAYGASNAPIAESDPQRFRLVR